MSGPWLDSSFAIVDRLFPVESYILLSEDVTELLLMSEDLTPMQLSGT